MNCLYVEEKENEVPRFNHKEVMVNGHKVINCIGVMHSMDKSGLRFCTSESFKFDNDSFEFEDGTIIKNVVKMEFKVIPGVETIVEIEFLNKNVGYDYICNRRTPGETLKDTIDNC